MPWKKKHSISESLIIITATSLVLTLTLLGYYWSQYRRADSLYNEIEKIAFNKDVTGTGDNGKGDNQNGLINHAALTARNGEYIGWLQVDGTDISYPVVQSKEELFYLRRDFDKNHSIAGTVFMDYRNSKDFTDVNTVLYGHNMHDGTMFAPLKKFLKSDFFDRYKRITVSIPGRVLQYEIFAVYKARVSSVPNDPGKLTQQEFDKFMAQISSLALCRRETAVTVQDNILTLATCGDNSGNSRIVIHAKLING